MNKEKFYVTSPIYYPNGLPHMGHAYTTTVCDMLARYHRLVGDETYFLTGTDENTSKVVKAAKKAGKDPQKFADEVVDYFKDFYKTISISNDQFIRTSDEKTHWPGAIDVWKKIAANGDIYKGTYKGLYCVGAEAFITEKDLVDGKCPDHDEEPVELEEENYFFKLSKYTDQVKKLIETDEIKVIPETRKNEILSLLEKGLEDVSFSRPKKEIPWGIPVPDDDEHVMYVWCDALTNYITALGYGRNEKLYDFWPGNHVIGKDIIRFHAAIWPAMLLSAGLPLPKTIMVHGMILSGGKKMSKTLGNILDPKEFVDEYGADALRYYLAREVSSFEDGDLTRERFKEAYNANLANGLGNLVNRILKLSEDNLDTQIHRYTDTQPDLPDEYRNAFDQFDIQKAAEITWEYISDLDKFIQVEQPFKVIKEDKEKGVEIIKIMLNRLYQISLMLEPFLSDTAEKIQKLIKENKKPDEPLFPRKDSLDSALDKSLDSAQDK